MGTELETVNNKNVLLNNLAALSNPDNIQKYIFGTKKDGYPRAVYDIVKDYTKPKKKKKKKDKYGDSTYSLYLMAKGKKGKKKKKKKNKYWHI